MRKIKYTKRGQPYIIQKNGRAKFIKVTSRTKKRKAKTRAIKKITRVRKMARRRTYKKSRSRRSNNSMFGKLNKPIVGSGLVILYEALVSPMIPLQGVAKDLLELGGGMYLSRKKGFVGAAGQMMVYLNTYQLMAGLAKPAIQSFTGSTGGYGYDSLSV